MAVVFASILRTGTVNHGVFIYEKVPRECVRVPQATSKLGKMGTTSSRLVLGVFGRFKTIF